MQRIVFLFGPATLREVLDASHPVILPFMMYENPKVLVTLKGKDLEKYGFKLWLCKRKMTWYPHLFVLNTIQKNLWHIPFP